MTKRCFFIVASLVFFTTYQVEERNQKSSEFELSERAAQLLLTGDTAPKTNLYLFELRDSFFQKISKYFDEYECVQTNFIVNFKVDSIHEIPLAVHSWNYQNCEVPLPPSNPYRNWYTVYITKNDSIYFERELIVKDSIDSEIADFYTDFPPEHYKRIYLALLWDKKTNRDLFQKVMSECIYGYLNVVKNQSLYQFGEKLKQLSDKEFNRISCEIPFRLRTDFSEHIIAEFLPF